MPRQTFQFEWDAHEYEHKERSQDWFWAMGIVTVAIAIASIIFGNIIFAILILIATFSLALFINRPPETIHVIVNERGVARGNIFYPYSSLDSFWIDEDHPHKKIILKSTKIFMPYIIVPLGDNTDAYKMHRVLIKHLDEEEHDLPFVEKILEYLGF